MESKIESFEQLVARVKSGNRKNIVVAAADDEHTLEAVAECYLDGLVDYTLVGSSEGIRSICTRISFDVPVDKIVHMESKEECAREAVRLINAGMGDVLMKGGLETATLLKAVVDKETGIGTGGVMSHIAVLKSPHYNRLFATTDGGMLIYPDLKQKSGALKNAISFFHGLGYQKPNAAILCAVETQSPKMPETVDAHELKKMSLDGEFGECVVEGPISFDLAVSEESCKIKGYESPVSGNADIFLFPNIAACNLFTKGLLYFGNAKMAGCVVGAKAPIALLSRSATAEEKYLSIALCAAYK